MGFFLKIKSRKKIRNPAIVDEKKLATHDDLEALTQELRGSDEKKKKRELWNKVLRLSPRKRRLLLKMIAERKEACGEKKAKTSR